MHQLAEGCVLQDTVIGGIVQRSDTSQFVRYNHYETSGRPFISFVDRSMTKPTVLFQPSSVRFAASA